VTFASVITPQVFVASGARPDGSGLQGSPSGGPRRAAQDPYQA
jgi:hypothetical protein